MTGFWGGERTFYARRASSLLANQPWPSGGASHVVCWFPPVLVRRERWWCRLSVEVEAEVSVDGQRCIGALHSKLGRLP